MPRFALAAAVGSAHNITQPGFDRQRVFFTDADHHVFLDTLCLYAQQARLRILAYCLMPHHIHLIATPEEPASLAVALRRTYSRYSQYLNTRESHSGPLWQSRFYSCALGEWHLWTALRYVGQNPMRAGLGVQPQDCPWSSAATHLGRTAVSDCADTLLDLEFWQREGGVKRWQALLGAADDYDTIRDLPPCTFTGRPYRDSEFITTCEQRLGRHLRARTWRSQVEMSKAANRP